MDIYFIRHGDPDYDHDCLTELGHFQAEKTSEELVKMSFDMIFASSMNRAIQTAKHLTDKTNQKISLLDWARAGAISCLNALTERDYFGLMTLDSEDNTILEPTPRTQETKILSAINTIQEATGGTIFASAIDSAGQALRALKVVDKKHIIIVSDGYVEKMGESPIVYSLTDKGYNADLSE